MTVDALREHNITAIVAAAKTDDGFQCKWCRRVLQQASGLVRHRAYCNWNPSLRDREKEMTLSNLKIEPTSARTHQCEWCNRFFQKQKGVLRHKTFCAWNPLRLRALKEDRARQREAKAAMKVQRDEVRAASSQALASFCQPDSSASTSHQPQLHINRASNHHMSRDEHSDRSSLSTSPSSSVDSPMSPHSHFNFPAERNPFTFHDEILRRPPVFSCRVKTSALPRPVHVSVISSCDMDCHCGCTKVVSHHQRFQHHHQQMRKSSLTESPVSSPYFYDDDEEINVES